MIRISVNRLHEKEKGGRRRSAPDEKKEVD